MDVILARMVALLMVAMLVAIAARRSRLPYTVGLVMTGLGLALLRVESGVALTPALITLVILPPLLFEAALNIHWPELRRDLAPVLVLTVAGVIVSAAVVAAAMIAGAGWPVGSALVFGVLISATDPVAVIAMFKDNGLGGRLRLLVESESLFNDGVAAVLFGVVLLWAEGGSLSLPDAVTALVLSAGGGFAIGLLCGVGAMAVAGRSADRLVETAISAAAAYGSFLLADHFHASGVLATVAAGLLMGNLRTTEGQRRSWLSSHSQTFLIEFWEFAAFIANSLVFLLIGLTLAGLPFARAGNTTIALAIGAVLAGRFLSIYPCCLLFRRSARTVPLAQQHVLWWGGLRGALGLALALSLPHSLPRHDEIVVATFGVVAFSILVQGLTMPQLLKILGFLPARR